MNAPPRLRFTIEQYHKMSEAGILDDQVRTELLRGEIVTMTSKGTPHEVCLTRLVKLLIPLIGDRAIVRVQSPILLPPDSEPEPDFSIVKLKDDEYISSHPLADDVLLLVEVADSSLHVDRGLKLGIYAESGIQNYWIFNVQDQELETYSVPILIDAAEISAGYRTHAICRKNDTIAIPELPGTKLDLRKVFK